MPKQTKWRAAKDPLFRGDKKERVCEPQLDADTSLVRHMLFLEGPGRETPYLSCTEQIENIIWLPHIVDKLAWKHHVEPTEVEKVLFHKFRKPLYRKVQKGHIPGENLYAALGQTEAGRFLIVFFVYKITHETLLISARDMSKQEKRQYERR